MSLASYAAGCCQHLASIPGLTIYSPGSTGYNSTQTSFWSLTESDLHPKCIVKPSSAEDVSRIVSTLVTNNCKFAIKSQGHAPGAGFANIDNGVTIDMTGMNQVSLDKTGKVASIGTGASWLDAYKYLDVYNKTVAGGRNGAVGVGGLTLGGGISYFSPQVGFTCDTAVNYQLVLADGQITNANQSCHPDLYRALKGGLNNFGVVTRVDLATIDYTTILAGSVAYALPQLPAVFTAFADLAAARPYDPHASIVLGLLFNGTAKAWSLSTTPIYTLPDPRPKVYEPLFAVPNATGKPSLALVRLGAFADEAPLPPLNWLFETVTFGVSAALLRAVFDEVDAELKAFGPPGETLWSLAFEPLPTVLVGKGAGRNVLGTTPGDGDGVVLLISAFWTDEAAAGMMRAKAREVVRKVRGLSERMGLGRRFVYANYAGPEQKVLEGYGGGNLGFLRGVAMRYDPKGVFQNLVPGGFKLRG